MHQGWPWSFRFKLLAVRLLFAWDVCADVFCLSLHAGAGASGNLRGVRSCMSLHAGAQVGCLRALQCGVHAAAFAEYLSVHVLCAHVSGFSAIGSCLPVVSCRVRPGGIVACFDSICVATWRNGRCRLAFSGCQAAHQQGLYVQGFSTKAFLNEEPLENFIEAVLNYAGPIVWCVGSWRLGNPPRGWDASRPLEIQGRLTFRHVQLALPQKLKLDCRPPPCSLGSALGAILLMSMQTITSLIQLVHQQKSQGDLPFVPWKQLLTQCENPKPELDF